MSSLLHLLSHVKRVRASSLRKQADTQKHTFRHRAFPSAASSSSVCVDRVNTVPTSSLWDLLPVELQINIFARCGITDLLSLKLVCKAFHQILTTHEQLIARQYLRQRRHGTLPTPVDGQKIYTRNPQDDVVLLSDLFPPAKSARGGYLYTFRYVYSLRRRQTLCSKLCYYLADRVIDRFVHSEPGYMKTLFPSKVQRNDFVKKATARIWFYLTPLMQVISLTLRFGVCANAGPFDRFYTLYFLETYAEARREQTNILLRDFEAGRLPVPIPPDVRKAMYRELQRKIIQAPPFTDTPTLISTHHCLQLLVSYLQHTVPPDEPGVSDDSWIGSLLTVSPFLRTVEYFSAEIGDGGNQRMQRKDFMYNFHHDIMQNENVDMNSLVFESAPNVHLHGSVQDVWFDVARAELSSRRISNHRAERIPIWQNLAIVFGCSDCRSGMSDGWRA